MRLKLAGYIAVIAAGIFLAVMGIYRLSTGGYVMLIPIVLGLVLAAAGLVNVIFFMKRRD